MENEIKSGKEILDDFFNKVEEIPCVDKSIASTLKELYQDKKLTSTNLSNALFKLRWAAGNDKD